MNSCGERQVGIAGAGVMGAGVAEVLLQQGYTPILYDIAEEALENARESIRRSLSARAMFSKNKSSDTISATLERLKLTRDLAQLGNADFIIENISEDLARKRSLYGELDKLAKESCILIANTSCIPISTLAGFTKRPAQVVGVHFMNPVPLKDTVELIPSAETSAATLSATQAFLGAIGKKAIVVKDSPGFVSNRVLMLTINEAIFLVQEEVASPADVDAVFTSCFGHKMGPLRTADLIGLDTILASLEVLLTCFEDDKFRPCPLLREMVTRGTNGRKSGQGFFSY